MYKEFKYQSSDVAGADIIKITMTGRITFGQAFIKEQGVKPSMGMKLYWDEDVKKLALVLSEESSDAFPIRLVPRGKAAYISANQFFRAHNLKPADIASGYQFEVTTSSELGVPGPKSETFVVGL
jgi:hypothetical protein